MVKTTKIYLKQHAERYFTIAHELFKYFNNLDTQGVTYKRKLHFCTFFAITVVYFLIMVLLIKVVIYLTHLKIKHEKGSGFESLRLSTNFVTMLPTHFIDLPNYTFPDILYGPFKFMGIYYNYSHMRRNKLKNGWKNTPMLGMKNIIFLTNVKCYRSSNIYCRCKENDFQQ